MKATLAAWLVNPVTLALAGAVVAGFLVVMELLLSNLARLGNVRFQGVIEDHPKVLTPVVDHDTHLSKVTDILLGEATSSLQLVQERVGRPLIVDPRIDFHPEQYEISSVGPQIEIERELAAEVPPDLETSAPDTVEPPGTVVPPDLGEPMQGEPAQAHEDALATEETPEATEAPEPPRP